MSNTNENPNEGTCATQNARISQYLESGKTVSSLEAVSLFGCMRLASRIFDIKQDPKLCSDVDKVRVKCLSTGKSVDAYYSVSAIAKRHGFEDGKYSAEDVKVVAKVYGEAQVNSSYRR